MSRGRTHQAQQVSRFAHVLGQPENEVACTDVRLQIRVQVHSRGVLSLPRDVHAHAGLFVVSVE